MKKWSELDDTTKSVLRIGLPIFIVILGFMTYVGLDNARWYSKSMQDIVDYNKEYDKKWSDYDDKAFSGDQCFATVKMFSQWEPGTIVFRAEDVDAESDYENVADFYCLPRKSLNRRIFYSSIVKDDAGSLKKIIFTLKEPLKDRVSYSVNLNQLNTRKNFQGRLFTSIGNEAIYNEVTHAYLTDDPKKYMDADPDIVDTDKLYDIYELLSRDDYGRIGYYLKESDIQH